MYISTLCHAKGPFRPYALLFALLFSFVTTLNADNIEDGGKVGIEQTICYGEIPATIFDITSASGGDINLNIEYLWMKSVPGLSDWAAIPGATEASYSPGVLNQTTAFIRCSRRSGFTNYSGESNVILITVLDGPLVVITSESPVGGSAGDELTFTGFSNLSYSTLIWDFGDGTTLEGSNVKYTFAFGGDKTVTLTATNPFNGCSSSTTIDFFLLGPLPVELGYFYGESTGDQSVSLQWSTVQEEINSHFEVQKSIDGSRFETIGYISGNGTTDETQFYSFKDEFPLEGINYYRLKQIDYNLEFSFSDVIAIRIDSESEIDYNLFPNPTNEKLNIRLLSIYDQEIIVLIKDVNNRVIKHEQIASNDLMHSIDLTDLAAGVYAITLWSSDIRSTSLFVKSDQ